MGLIVFCVILLFVVINNAIRGRGDDDDFDGDVFAKAPSRPSRKLPRSIVFNNHDDKYDDDDEEYEDDDDEYYDDDYVEDEVEGVKVYKNIEDVDSIANIIIKTVGVYA